MTTGKLFNIQPYSIHDGPGIRTTFFVKGCPLRCKWCQNPESQASAPVLLFYESKCKGCGLCAGACPHNAIHIVKGKAKTNRAVCRDCGSCCGICPAAARELSGKEWDIETLVDKALDDKLFIDESKGGITLSGGEPLLQPQFAAEFLRACKKKGFHTALDTTGFAGWEAAKPVFEAADLILFDIKHMDSLKHKALTGVPNELILQNLIRLHELEKEIYIRVPVIPGMNDDEKNLRNMASFIQDKLDAKYKVFLLPFHNLGNAKLQSLEQEDKCLYLEPPTALHMQSLKAILEEYGINVQIGG